MDGPNNPRAHNTRRIRKGRFAYLADRSSSSPHREIKSDPTPALPCKQGSGQDAGVMAILLNLAIP
jgi:hypothetical protein